MKKVIGLMPLFLLFSFDVWAQSGAIVGTVTDSSGAVIPGVTIDAVSPALIAGSRSTISDDAGFYRILELRPGMYTVTFTLPGFQALRRENIELTTGFTATVNAALSPGTLDQAITITDEGPLVDTLSTTVQTVLNRAVLDALPIGKGFGAYASLLPAAGSLGPNQDVGGNKGENGQAFSAHGGRSGDYQQSRDGMLSNSLIAAGNILSSTNPALVQEVVVTAGGFGTNAQTGGGSVNIVYKEGGNNFTGSFRTDFSNKSMQSNNLNDALRARRAATPLEIRDRYDVGGGFGGPIKKDKLWFVVGWRYWTTSTYQPNNYYNKTQGTMFYTPDLSRPAYDQVYYRTTDYRLTWQATPRNKFNATFTRERNCNCFFNLSGGPAGSPGGGPGGGPGGATVAPEASGSNLYTPNNRIQGTWISPITNKLLLSAGFTYQHIFVTRKPEGEGTEAHRSILELSNNYRYNAPGTNFALPNSFGTQDNIQANQTASVSYIVGGHTFKVGFQLVQGIQEKESRIADNMTFTFRNQIPTQITVFAGPYNWKTRVDYSGYFVEDQWKLRKLALNLGLRYDGLRGSFPDQHLAAGPYVPERNFKGESGVPRWNDFNPRLGAAYDLFGTGRTAIKASLSRSVVFEPPAGLTNMNNPVNAMVVSATREWDDTNRDYIPQETELGPLSNTNFGQIVRNTFYADDVMNGWHVRPYNWQGSLSVQQELMSGLAVDVGWFRTWYGNFRVNDNTLVTSADFDPYCIPAPSDSRLPGGGGQQICRLADIKPGKFGQVRTLVSQASKFGKQTEVFNGFDATMQFRRSGYFLSGGMSTGSTTTDRCFVVDSPQELYQCRNTTDWYGNTQLKFNGVVPLPWGFQVAGTFQMYPSIPLQANYVAANDLIRPSLNRNLGQCGANPACNATATIPLIPPGTEFRENWNRQVDLRFSRNFGWERVNFQPTVEFFNIFNAAPVLMANSQYGPQWQTVIALLGSRVMRLGAQFRF